MKAFTEGRAATKAAGASGNGGGGQGVTGETASDPGAQPTDAVPNVIPMGWLPGKRVRLLIADEHLAARADLRDMLEEQPDFEVVGEAATGAEAVQLTDQLHPRVVLMDLHMPEMDATEAITQVKAEHPDTHVLIMTTYDSDNDIPPAIEAGATGYLLKDAPHEELLEAIRTAAQGKPLPAPSTAARSTERITGSIEENRNKKVI